MWNNILEEEDRFSVPMVGLHAFLPLKRRLMKIVKMPWSGRGAILGNVKELLIFGCREGEQSTRRCQCGPLEKSSLGYIRSSKQTISQEVHRPEI